MPPLGHCIVSHIEIELGLQLDTLHCAILSNIDTT